MDTDQPLFVFFRAQLRRLRTQKGWTQEALAKRIGFSSEMVSKVETGSVRPSADFAAALDIGFPEMHGMFSELVDHAEACDDVYPEWFRCWVDAEQRASIIRWWQPLLIPGLLQTEGYARAVYEAWRAVDGNPKIDADVAARLERQAILDRPTPPSFGAVIDETVLHREIGGPEVMREQLTHLADMSERPLITIQVLPGGIGAHVGLVGAFAVAHFPGTSDGMVYMESPNQGTTSKDPDTVARLAVAYDSLRDEALGARASPPHSGPVSRTASNNAGWTCRRWRSRTSRHWTGSSGRARRSGHPRSPGRSRNIPRKSGTACTGCASDSGMRPGRPDA